MRVLLNIESTLYQRTGVGVYTQDLMRTLMDVDHPDFEVQLYPSSVNRLLLRSLKHVAPALKVVFPKKDGVESPVAMIGDAQGRRPLAYRIKDAWFKRDFQKNFDHGHCDVYHEPNLIPHETGIKTITTVHDLSALLYPEWHPLKRVRHHERHFQRGINQSRYIVTISQAIKAQIQRELGVPGSRITTIYPTPREDMVPLEEASYRPVLDTLKLSQPYLLYVGTLEPRKNVLNLLKSYCAIPRDVRAKCPLVLVGSWGWNYEKIREYYDTHAKHEHVIHLNYVHDRLMPALMNGARALVFPTNYEGLGLPPIEMLSCGGAAIVSQDAAVVEGCGDWATTVAANDLDGWRDAMQEAILAPGWREAHSGFQDDVRARYRREIWKHPR